MNTFIRRISDLKTSIFLLSLLIISSLIGSVVDQNTLSSSIENLNNSTFFSKIYTFLDFSHLFTTGWFLTLNILIAISLLTCTSTQQLPSFDFCRSINFLKSFLKNQNFDVTITTSKNIISDLIIQLLNKDYLIFQKSKSFYASKGLIARIGPFFVHMSLIFIFLGGFLSSISGFTAQEFVPKGEITYLTNLPDSNFFDQLPSYPVRINDFWISHLPSGAIYQFYTNLSSLTSLGVEKNVFTISVNHPFPQNGILWYQTDWDVIGLKWKVNDLIYQIPVTRLAFGDKKIWLSWLPFYEPISPIFFETLRGELILLSNLSTSNLYLEVGQSINLNSNFNFKFIDILSCTGLQVHSDPGNFFLCFGFVNLIISTFLSYLSYSRIWIIKNTQNLIVGGLTNRAKLNFELEFFKLFDKLFLINSLN